jgi:hypothetical protein
MIPVALTWQEMSVVHMHAMTENLQATIQLASYFANVSSNNAMPANNSSMRNVVAAAIAAMCTLY